MVADTGCGVPPGHEEKVFLKFHRASSTVQEGAGLIKYNEFDTLP
jgi:signal transduction histidine kinase